MVIRDIAILFGYEVDKKTENAAENSIKGLKDMATKLLGAIGIGFSLVQLNAIAEEFNGINDQIRNATKQLGNQEEIQQKILKAANDTRSSYADMANVVSTLIQSDHSLFGSVEEATEFATLTTKLFKTAGKSNEEVKSLQEALNKSFAKGIVDSETLNRLYERAPEAINLISKSLGVAKEKLADMASKGTFTVADLKKAFISNADEINAGFETLDFSISDALLNIRNQWGLWVDSMNSSLGLSQTIGRFMVRSFTQIMEVLKKATTFVERLADRVGGFDNLLKLVAVTAAAIFVALNAQKILAFLAGVGKLLTGINFKMLAIVAVIVAVFLIIDDFINFMKGNDSVIGKLLEKAGVDTEKVRQTIIAAWESIKSFLLAAWDFIKQVASTIWEGLKDFWAQNGDEIKSTLLAVWDAIKSTLGALWEALKAIAIAVFGALQDFWNQWGDQIIAQFEILWNFLSSLVMSFLTVIRGIAEFIAGVFTGDWEKAWNGIKTIFEGVWNGIQAFFVYIWDTIYNWFGEKIDAIVAKVTGFVDAIKQKIQAVKDFFGGIGDAIGKFFGGGDMKATVSASTAGAAAGGGNRTSNVNQNVNITNNFNGGDVSAQKAGAKAMSKSAYDATSYMARGLAYGR
jgi:tape measure domain-containing protein